MAEVCHVSMIALKSVGTLPTIDAMYTTYCKVVSSDGAIQDNLTVPGAIPFPSMMTLNSFGLPGALAKTSEVMERKSIIMLNKERENRNAWTMLNLKN
jgi:hypothetical protein